MTSLTQNISILRNMAHTHKIVASEDYLYIKRHLCMLIVVKCAHINRHCMYTFKGAISVHAYILSMQMISKIKMYCLLQQCISALLTCNEHWLCLLAFHAHYTGHLEFLLCADIILPMQLPAQLIISPMQSQGLCSFTAQIRYQSTSAQQFHGYHYHIAPLNVCDKVQAYFTTISRQLQLHYVIIIFAKSNRPRSKNF